MSQSFFSAEGAEHSTAATYVNAFAAIYSVLRQTSLPRAPLSYPAVYPVIVLAARFRRRQTRK